MATKPTVAVIMGGRSAERDVSLGSGENVAAGLEEAGFTIVRVEIAADGRWVARGPSGGDASVELAPGDMRAAGQKVDLAFIALHGPFGEDGCIQGLLDVLGVPYTGSGVLASALAMDKLASKRMFRQTEIPTARWVAVDGRAWQDSPPSLAARAAERLGWPVVVKPSGQGSSIGVAIAKGEDELVESVDQALEFGRTVLIEEYVQGREIQCGIIGNREPEALPLVEICPKKEFFDFEAKYDPALADEICPAPVEPESAALVTELSLKAYCTFDCRGFARVDTFLKEDGRVLVSEINTIPGMTGASLYPKEAAAAGIEFPDLVERIVRLALEEE